MGRNQYWCEPLQRKMEALQWQAVCEAPLHLMLTVKLFTYDAAAQRLVKRLEDVQFPAFLRLPVVSSSDGGAGATAAVAAAAAAAAAAKTVGRGRSPSLLHRSRLSTDDSTEHAARSQPRRVRRRASSMHLVGDDTVPYGLYAVVTHQGHSANSGHYYMFGRLSHASNTGIEDCAHNPWFRIDDAVVRRVSFADMRDELCASKHDTAYMLLYRRLSDQEAREAEQAGGSTATPSTAHVDSSWAAVSDTTALPSQPSAVDAETHAVLEDNRRYWSEVLSELSASPFWVAERRE